MESPLLSIAANGRYFLTFEDSEDAIWELALNWLASQGFLTEGEAFDGLGQVVYPSFVKGDLEISAGWDNWSGNNLLAETPETDHVLLEMSNLVQAIDRRAESAEYWKSQEP